LPSHSQKWAGDAKATPGDSVVSLKRLYVATRDLQSAHLGEKKGRK